MLFRSLSLSLLVCPCVGVFGFVVFVVDFLFLWLIFDFVSMEVCASKQEADDEGVGFADKEEREKKKGANLEIIKIMYRRATVIVHICMVTVALVHLCTILDPPM